MVAEVTGPVEVVEGLVEGVKASFLLFPFHYLYFYPYLNLKLIFCMFYYSVPILSIFYLYW